MNSLAIDGGCRQIGQPHATFSHIQVLHRPHSTDDMCRIDQRRVMRRKDITDLKMTKDAPAEDTSALEDTMQDCPAKAAKFEAATNSRSEELEALAKGRAVISEKTKRR